jgi:hypothetical protein
MNQDLANRASNGVANSGQLLESIETFPSKECVDGLSTAAHTRGGASIGVDAIVVSALVAKESGCLLQASSHVFVYPVRHVLGLLVV